VKRSVIVDVTARLILPSALLFALHLLLVGHDRPGGGFVGGLVAGAAVAAIYVAGGIDDVRTVVPVRPWTILGGGLVLAAGMAVLPVLQGDPALYKWSVEPSLPVLGDFKVSSVLIFDIGVSLVVIGLVFMVFEAFGDEEPPEFRGEPLEVEPDTGIPDKDAPQDEGRTTR
jgi:multisubunit Na+/H+ antiporter MnhB subunit